ncbi:ferrochelatase 2 [Betaproteobacteria bacterium]|nr:ferrochelatase 2 [Betaproteobacteria bacterium]
MRYTFYMNSNSLIGILLVNTGTPNAPTKKAVVQYLRRFLMDKRIVNIPSLIWWPILNAFVLRVRPTKTLGIYRRIWTPDGSPYTIHSQALERALKGELASRGRSELVVRMAHRYGDPSMGEKLLEFQQHGIKRVIVLPLYPQQALATTASVKDELDRQLTALKYAPELTFIENYHSEALWIEAIANSIRPYLTAEKVDLGVQPAVQQEAHAKSRPEIQQGSQQGSRQEPEPQPGPGPEPGPEADTRSQTHLLLSFHSVPLKDIRKKDLYKQQIEQSVTDIAASLNLQQGSFSWAYHSRFDDAQRWLGPFLLDKLAALEARGVKHLLVACPGFAVDCTESLYDIDIKLASELKANGIDVSYTYVPCLNASQAHIQALASIVERAL